jgi:site-specific recombinase XerC
MATLHRRRAALSEFAKWGVDQRLWVTNPMAGAPKIKKPEYVPRPVIPEERTRLLALELPPAERLVARCCISRNCACRRSAVSASATSPHSR